MSRIAYLVLFVLAVCLVFTGCGINYRISIGSGSRQLLREDAKEFDIEKTVTEPITSIDIKTGIADIELVKSDDYYVEIDYLYWEDEPEYTLKDGKLTFDDDHSLPDSYSINFDPGNIIRIYLPEDALLDHLFINSSSGNVMLSGFAADDLKATVSYGDFTMKEAAAVTSTIKLSSGKSKISDFQTGDLDYSNSYGNADFTNINTGDPKLPPDTVYDKININMSSGNADINGLNTASFEIENSYGNITCMDMTADSFDARLSSGNLNISSADIKEADITDSYGSVTLDLLGKEDDYSLDLNTSYGNIRVSDKSYDQHLTVNSSGSNSVTASLSSGDIKLSFKNE